MQLATTESVLGDFTGPDSSGTTVDFHGIKSRLFQKKEPNQNGERFFIETLGADGQRHLYPIKYTFGYRPLQQYLVETEKGHIQALNLAWDSRPQAQGGQRWFHLQADEDITADHPFFWPRHFQNWNSRCAQCHSTNVELNYDAKENSYNTSFSEINVACESCHGPASSHLENVQQGLLSTQGSGFGKALGSHLQWQFDKDDPIANPKGIPDNTHLTMCGGCHSRRSVIGDIVPGSKFDDQFRISLLSDDLYHPDGQIQDEVFVFGSFLQSKMHAEGVTCSNCHEPHTGELVLEGNNLCGQCHQSTVFDTASHHFHKPGQAACVDCHMPATTYMLVDDRRDHRFGSPDPDLTQRLGVPNACTSCHENQPASWAINALAGRTRPDEFALLNARVRLGDPLVADEVAAFVEDETNPVIERATLLALGGDVTRDRELVLRMLESGESLLRVAAITSIASFPASEGWRMLMTLAGDPAASVRFEAGRVISGMIAEIPLEKMDTFVGMVQEYRGGLGKSLDMPSTQTELGNLELSLGKTKQAHSAYKTALRVEPDYVPARLNLADYYRGTAEEDKAASLLKQTLEFAPDSGAANYSYALSLVRQGDTERALRYFKTAIEQRDSQPTYAYVYAVALDSVSRTPEALDD